jgi:hypothetical protein
LSTHHTLLLMRGLFSHLHSLLAPFSLNSIALLLCEMPLLLLGIIGLAAALLKVRRRPYDPSHLEASKYNQKSFFSPCE